MAALFRGKPAKPEYTIPPAETREAHAQAEEVEAIDRSLTALKLIPHSRRSAAWPVQANRLLDLRNAIRPPRVTSPADVSYVPGGPIR